MTISPIMPIWLMILIIVILIFFRSKDKKSFIRQIIIIILLFIINLRIKIPTSNLDSKKVENNLEILFVVDTTISMLAEDYNGNNTRLSGVKEDCKYIINKLNGAKFSIMIFNNNSSILTPYINDSNITIEAIDTMQAMNESAATGSSLNVCLKDMKNSLKSYQNDENKSKILFFISDGEMTKDEDLKSFSELKQYISNGAVLGYGTEKGGYMKVKYSMFLDDENYLIDNTKDYTESDQRAISKMDEKNLKKIADDMGIDYINMSKQSNIDDKLNQIKDKTVYEIGDSNSKKSGGMDIYYIFVLPLTILLIYEFINYKRRV